MRKLALSLVLLILGFGCAVAQSVTQPPQGSQLRKELLDAARPVFEKETGGPVEFVVHRLNVMNGWAFGDVFLQRPGGGRIDWGKTKYALPVSFRSPLRDSTPDPCMRSGLFFSTFATAADFGRA